MGQGVTRMPWVQPTLNVYNGQIISPHTLMKMGQGVCHFGIIFISILLTF